MGALAIAALVLAALSVAANVALFVAFKKEKEHIRKTVLKAEKIFTEERHRIIERIEARASLEEIAGLVRKVVAEREQDFSRSLETDLISYVNRRVEASELRATAFVKSLEKQIDELQHIPERMAMETGKFAKFVRLARIVIKREVRGITGIRKKKNPDGLEEKTELPEKNQPDLGYT